MIEKFKYYKRKDKQISFEAVIDCSDKDADKIEAVRSKFGENFPKIGLKHPDDWKIYSLKQCSGLIIIKNAFEAVGQRYWIKKLVKDYTKNHPNNLLQSRFSENEISDFWKAYTDETDEQHKRLIKKSMRWTTLGLHYDWTKKIYDENYKDEFPEELNILVATIAQVLGFEHYKSEAAIINFYHIGTTLAAHVDQSEICDRPLFSISFGQSAIFLIGGLHKKDDAIPILINSGDIIIMSGESRFLYHSVPRIFEAHSQPWNEDLGTSYCSDLKDDLNDCTSKEKWEVFEQYLKDSRINVNVRQFKI